MTWRRASFADEFSVSREYAVLVFDVPQPVVSLSFQVLRLQVLVEAGLIAFPNACLAFADEGSQAQHGILANLPKIFASHLHGLSKVAAAELCA